MKFQNIITGEETEPQAWQLALKPGDCYVNDTPVAAVIRDDGTAGPFKPMPVMYCQVLSEATEIGPGFLWVRAFSVFEPRGERGIACVVDPTRLITKQEFDQAIKEMQT